MPFFAEFWGIRSMNVVNSRLRITTKANKKLFATIAEKGAINHLNAGFQKRKVFKERKLMATSLLIKREKTLLAISVE